MSEFFDFLALGMSAIGIGVSVWATRHSKRSADAAEISAIEAKNARKVSQADLLLKHFLVIDRAFDVLVGKIGASASFKAETQEAVVAIGALIDDVDTREFFCKVLSKLELWFGQQISAIAGVHVAERDAKAFKEESLEMRNKFERLKTQYLSIG